MTKGVLTEQNKASKINRMRELGGLPTSNPVNTLNEQQQNKLELVKNEAKRLLLAVPENNADKAKFTAAANNDALLTKLASRYLNSELGKNYKPGDKIQISQDVLHKIAQLKPGENANDFAEKFDNETNRTIIDVQQTEQKKATPHFVINEVYVENKDRGVFAPNSADLNEYCKNRVYEIISELDQNFITDIYIIDASSSCLANTGQAASMDFCQLAQARAESLRAYIATLTAFSPIRMSPPESGHYGENANCTSGPASPIGSPGNDIVGSGPSPFILIAKQTPVPGYEVDANNTFHDIGALLGKPAPQFDQLAPGATLGEKITNYYNQFQYVKFGITYMKAEAETTPGEIEKFASLAGIKLVNAERDITKIKNPKMIAAVAKMPHHMVCKAGRRQMRCPHWNRSNKGKG
jgi:hypothetical protein